MTLVILTYTTKPGLDVRLLAYFFFHSWNCLLKLYIIFKLVCSPYSVMKRLFYGLWASGLKVPLNTWEVVVAVTNVQICILLYYLFYQMSYTNCNHFLILDDPLIRRFIFTKFKGLILILAKFSAAGQPTYVDQWHHFVWVRIRLSIPE